MADYLDFPGLQRYDNNLKTRISNGYYNKDEVDTLLATIESDILWKDAVATYADIATTYPFPHIGWTVTALDTNTTYRYDGSSWVVINNGLAPIATTENDGLMRKEFVTQLNGLGTASTKNFTTTVDQSTNLPTAKAVNTFVTDLIASLNAQLEAEIDTKVNIDDVGDASGSNTIDEIPDQKETIEFKGEWYSSTADDTFVVKGTGLLDGIDMTFVQSVNNYTLHSNIKNYSNAVSVSLHMSGTKESYPIEVTIADGQTFSIDEVPDECLDGDATGTLEIKVLDYSEGKVKALNFFSLPTIWDEGNSEDIQIVKTSAYNKTIVHQEYDTESENHILYGNFGLYSSADLPTSSAVSSLVQTVTEALRQVLEAHIDEVEAKIDDYEEASDEDIEALFGDHEATDEDIENLFG